MDKDEAVLETEIQLTKPTQPRITPEQINEQIVDVKFHRFEGTTLTVCVLVLQNGYTVTGESACVAPENYNEEIGRKIAYTNAREKIWALEGYALANQLRGIV